MRQSSDIPAGRLYCNSTLEGLLASRVVRVMLAEDFRGASAARKRAV